MLQTYCNIAPWCLLPWCSSALQQLTGWVQLRRSTSSAQTLKHFGREMKNPSNARPWNGENHSEMHRSPVLRTVRGNSLPYLNKEEVGSGYGKAQRGDERDDLESELDGEEYEVQRPRELAPKCGSLE